MSDELTLSYDRIAKAYADHLGDELDHKPFDRHMLRWLIERVGGDKRVCDLGCGPGHISRFLAEHGARPHGIDLSPGMIDQARALQPGLVFSVGDLRELSGVTDRLFDGVVAFYSLIHLQPDEVPRALAEIRRIVKPGGTLLASFHLGSEVRHLDSMWDVPVSLDFRFFEREQMKQWLTDAGFQLDEVIERDPYPPPAEVQTRRAYVFAHV